MSIQVQYENVPHWNVPRMVDRSEGNCNMKRLGRHVSTRSIRNGALFAKITNDYYSKPLVA